MLPAPLPVGGGERFAAIGNESKKINNHLNLKIMNTLRNKVQLIGNLGMNPEVKEIKNGRKMAKFSMATNETYKNSSGEKVTETQWHNIVIWGKAADVAERFLQKGSEVAVEGKLISRSYSDKEGNKRYITEIEARDILLLGKKN